jgi:hypothetical protein
MKRPVSTGDPKDAPFVETVTHVPGIKHVTLMIEGKPRGTSSPTPAPSSNHQPAPAVAPEKLASGGSHPPGKTEPGG